MQSTHSPFEAIIFDFDGVILESADIKTDAFVELFEAYPEHQDAVLRHHLDNLGVSRYQKFEWIYRELLQQPLAEAERERLGKAFSALVFEKVLACSFVPGARETLAALVGQVPMFVASGTPQPELLKIVERRNLTPFFTEVRGTPPEKSALVKDLIDTHNLAPERTVLVGDGVSDYEAALHNHIPFIARSTPALDATWQEKEVHQITDVRALLPLVNTSVPHASS